MREQPNLARIQAQYGIKIHADHQTPFSLIASDLGIEHTLTVKVRERALHELPRIIRRLASHQYQPLLATANGAEGTIIFAPRPTPSAEGFAELLGLRVKAETAASKVDKRLKIIFAHGDANHATFDPGVPGYLQIAPDLKLSISYQDAVLEADDGSAMIRRSAALRLLKTEDDPGPSLYAVQVQSLGPAGVHKGYFIVHDDDVLDSDIVFPRSAWRDDLVSTKYTFTRARAVKVKPEPTTLRPVSYNQSDHLWHHLDVREIANVMINRTADEDLLHYERALGNPLALQEIMAQERDPDADHRPRWAQSGDWEKRLGWITEAHALSKVFHATGWSPWSINTAWSMAQSPVHRLHQRRQRVHAKRQMAEAPVLLVSQIRLNISYHGHQGVARPRRGHARLVFRDDLPVAVCHDERDNAALRKVLGGHDNDDYVDCVLCRDADDQYWLLESRLPKNPGCSALMRLSTTEARRLIQTTGAHAYRLRTREPQYEGFHQIPCVMQPPPVATSGFSWDIQTQLERLQQVITLAAPIGMVSRLQNLLSTSGFFDPSRHKVEFSDWLDLSSKGETDLEPLIQYLLDEICRHVAGGGQLDPVGLSSGDSWLYRRIAERFRATEGSELYQAARFSVPETIKPLAEASQRSRQLMESNQDRLMKVSNGPAAWLVKEIPEPVLQLAREYLERRDSLWRNRHQDFGPADPRAAEEALMNDYWRRFSEICSEPAMAIAAWQRAQLVRQMTRLRRAPTARNYYRGGLGKPLAYLPETAWQRYAEETTSAPVVVLEYRPTSRRVGLTQGESYRAEVETVAQRDTLTLRDEQDAKIAVGTWPKTDLDGFLDGQRLTWKGDCPIAASRPQTRVGAFELDPNLAHRLLVQ